MRADGLTRRSLLAAGAGALAGAAAAPAAAGAATLRDVRPQRTGARPGGAAGEPLVFEQRLGDLAGGGVARELALEANADLLGVRWQGPADAQLQLRYRDEWGDWSSWVSAGGRGHGPDVVRAAPASAGSAAGSSAGATVGEPVWSGGSRSVEVRSNVALGEVSVICVDVSGGQGARVASRRARAASLEHLPASWPAGPGSPPIIARAAWARGHARPRVAPSYGAVSLAFVHHTDNPNGYGEGEVPAMVLAIYLFHVYGNGWNDIGYNFVLDRFGRIFEARAGGIDEPVVGAHAGGYNLYSTGVAVLGTYTAQPISRAARTALARLLAWKLSLHGVPIEGRVSVRVTADGARYSRFPAGTSVSLPRVAGHRDGDSTDCPGDDLYAQLPGLRPQIALLAGRAARLTLALAATPAPSPTTPTTPPTAASPTGASPTGAAEAGATGTAPTGSTTAPTGTASPTPTPAPAGAAQALAGTFSYLNGAPVVGAPIAIQVRTVSQRGESVSERTLAQAQTGADGSFSVTLALPVLHGNAAYALRALCPSAPGVPAGVSAPLTLTGAG